MSKYRAILISLPWANYRTPSLPIGSLASYARKMGFNIEARHLHLDAAAVMGLKRYDDIIMAPQMASDAIGAALLFPKRRKKILKLTGEYIEAPGAQIEHLRKALRAVYNSVDWCR